MRWIKARWVEVQAWLGPLWSGVLLGVATLVGLSFGLFEMARLGGIASPTPDVLRDLAGFGGALFIAFTVAFGAVVISDQWDRAERHNWVGYGVGIGVGGLAAVGIAIATAAHIEAGHSGDLDLAGLAAAIAGPLMLGVIVLAFAASALLDV